LKVEHAAATVGGIAHWAPANAEPRTGKFNAARLSKQVVCHSHNGGICVQPNESFNADANIGHRFAILMANVGALRPYRASGAG
jgi:hypothetical protein